MDNGFSEQRVAKKGIMWSDGISTLIVPTVGQGINVRSERNLQADIKRALAKREVMLAANLPIPSPKAAINETFRRYESVQEEPELDDQPEQPEETEMKSHILRPAVQPHQDASSTPPVPELFLAILTDPHLTDTKKVRMLTAYLED